MEGGISGLAFVTRPKLTIFLVLHRLYRVGSL